MDAARTFWKALMENATALVNDADTLLKVSSFGRARSLTVLAQEELGQELAAFWGDFSSYEGPGDTEEQWAEYFAKRQKEAEEVGNQANQAKMLGFYVDTDPDTGEVLSPMSVGPGTIPEDLHTAAQAIEMLLIKDHSRMKLDADTPYDSTHAQQLRLLPISHPEDWEAASEEFKTGFGFSPSEYE